MTKNKSSLTVDEEKVDLLMEVLILKYRTEYRMYIMHKTDIMVFAIYLGTGIQAELVDSQLISTSGTKIIIVSGTNRSNGHVQLYFYCTLKLDMISREEIVLQSAH